MSHTFADIQRPPLPQPELAAPQGPLRVAWAILRRIAENMVGLDYRSLALMRVCAALILLWVTWINASEMRAFYTDEGVLSRIDLFQNPGEFLGFSLHFANGGMPYIATLFGIQFVLNFLMLIGYRTRLATVGSYLLLLSMQNRQPILLYGADIALRVGLFWMMFLPLARRFSLDALTGRVRPGTGRPHVSFAGIALILQVCCIYTGSSLMKTGYTWQVEHSAVAYALALDVYGRPLGHWLGQHRDLAEFLTIFTLNLEKFGPALFLFPIFSKWTRILGILLFAGMQIGFGMCMTMGTFGPVMITLTLALLPALFWDRMAGPIARWTARRFFSTRPPFTWIARPWQNWLERRRARNALSLWHTPKRTIRLLRISAVSIRETALALLAVVLVLWNVGMIPALPPYPPAAAAVPLWRAAPAAAWKPFADLIDTKVWPPMAPGGRWTHRNLSTFVYTIGLNQTWDMFSPDPQSTDGWIIVAGTLRNGSVVDLMSGEPVTYEKPQWVPASYHSTLWMSYFLSFWSPGSSKPDSFAQYICKSWNDRHPRDQWVQSIEIDMMGETIEVGPTRSEVVRTVVYQQ
ncbi:MAG TPA: HTTM domain-containing protein [Phycisphaerae bacterium]|nr:HTTM domain-containing protein [Phycisphaerae bacterium]